MIISELNGIVSSWRLAEEYRWQNRRPIYSFPETTNTVEEFSELEARIFENTRLVHFDNSRSEVFEIIREAIKEVEESR